MSIISHVSLGTNDFARSKAFYDAVLATLGIPCMMTYEGNSAGYGKEFPEFWIGSPHDGNSANAGNGWHVCFNAERREQVDNFHARAVEFGGKDEGKPGLRPEYTPDYYAAFVRDPDGNKIEAVCLMK